MPESLRWLQQPLGVTIFWLLLAFQVAVLARAITRRDRTPASRIAWVAVVLSLPALGTIAYLLLGETSIGRGRISRLHRAEQMLGAIPTPQAPLLPPAAQLLSNLCAATNGLGPVGGNRIELLGSTSASPNEPMLDSDAAIERLISDIAESRDHVHISFYIWLDDGNGGRVADAIVAAALRGVACRVIVDSLGSRSFIRSRRWQQLREAGVRLLATLDDIPRIGHLALGRIDLRNHRKLVVIDNAIAFCGSQNCADPEFRVLAKFAPWVDIFLRCEGPIVRQAQWLFLSTWMAETGEELESLPSQHPLPAFFAQGAVAQMYGCGPSTAGDAMSDSFVGAVYAARRELLITTPYFVPDEALLRALCAAPRRGVRTTIVFPKRNNSLLVAYACRSTYRDLLQAGVSIYEYPLGLLHTKSLTADGQFSLVGSANLDRRSLQLNFENNLLIMDPLATSAITNRQEGYVRVSEQIALEVVEAWPFHMRLLQNAIGMMSPVL